MARIKVKKHMELTELIKWGFKNKIKNESFLGSDLGTIQFDDMGDISISVIGQNETFTVTIEEEIDEDTKLPTLIELFVCDYGQIMHMYHNESINDAIGDVDEDARAMSKAFYILNDDLSMTLIWREGEFVE
ncbi:hypothetical protein [Staphylococcus chromogenes]|uniref:hypothetical protein n=1 Tax=Staphylococcus chromogenes TaxID=46126 RepID=UPI00188F3204|nr:hypothetical protein [Staphylococcus chromogenes]